MYGSLDYAGSWENLSKRWENTANINLLTWKEVMTPFLLSKSQRSPELFVGYMLTEKSLFSSKNLLVGFLHGQLKLC